MEGRRLEEEEQRGTEYRPYRPQAFDEDAAGPPRPAAPEEAGAEFQRQFSPDAENPAAFEDGPRGGDESETDFASLRFQRENTLLTNAESYAASIREEAQLYVRQLRSEVEALNQQAEERYQEAEQIKAEAEAEAERLLAEAQAQVEQVREQARQEGFDAGREEGLKQRYEEAAPHLERLDAILKEIGQFRKRVAFYTEKDGVRLALLIAKKVLRAELKVNKQVVAKLLASTLAKLDGKGTFRVWLNPEDYQFITAARPALERYLDEEQALTLRAKPDLRPGNVLIETDREIIDLTFASQFYHLEQQLSQTLAERESVLLQRRTGAQEALVASAARKAARAAAPKTAAEPPQAEPAQAEPPPDAAPETDAPAEPEPPSDGG